tara:strand:- start:1652 stop:3655 length:2004 start_codon:yes stop_codon:yes gene_type:complete
MDKVLTLEAHMLVNGLDIQHSSEWEDYLEMNAQINGMSREEYASYYLNTQWAMQCMESIVNLYEGKKVTRKQLDKALGEITAITQDLKATVLLWKDAKENGNGAKEAEHLDTLKKLNADKKAAEQKVEDFIKSLDKNVELKITEQAEAFGLIEGFTSKLNTIRQKAKDAKDFIKKTLSDSEFSMFNGNQKFKTFLGDFYLAATESVNEKIYRVYLDGDYEEHYTEDPFASKAKAIKQAKDMAKKHKGLIEVTPDDDIEDVVWTNESNVNEANKIACLECDEVNTEAKWRKNNNFCPSCKTSNNGVAESITEATEVTKDMWDKEWPLKKVFGKEYEANFAKRVEAAMSKAKNEEQAEEWAYKNFKQLPNPAKGMTIEESAVYEKAPFLYNLGYNGRNDHFKYAKEIGMAVKDIEGIRDYHKMAQRGGKTAVHDISSRILITTIGQPEIKDAIVKALKGVDDNLDLKTIKSNYDASDRERSKHEQDNDMWKWEIQKKEDYHSYERKYGGKPKQDKEFTLDHQMEFIDMLAPYSTTQHQLADIQITSLEDFLQYAADHVSPANLKKVTKRIKKEYPKLENNNTRYMKNLLTLESFVNEARAPKNWDSQFTMNAIEAYENGEFDLEDDKSIAEWDKKYNGGKAPKPAFNTKEVVSYAIKTGKKPNGDKMDK